MTPRALYRGALLLLWSTAVVAATVAARGAAPPALVGAGVAALLLALPSLPILLLRWVNPRTSAMMQRTRRRFARRTDRPRAIEFEWVDLARVSREMWLAVIAAEDAFFRDHHGFDWESIRDAHAHNRVHEQKRGGSTITQQVAKNLFLWPARSYVRKAVEAWLTVLIEACWPKRRILEVYLNIAQFGEDLFGVQAAARRYFGKAPRGLTRADAALLAASLPSPVRHRVEAPSHQVRFRQTWVLGAMRRLGDLYLERF